MRKLTIFSAGFAAASAAYVYYWGDARALLLAGACLVLSLIGGKLGFKRLAVGLLGVCAAFLWCTGYQWVFSRNSVPSVEEERPVTIRVTDLPRSTKYGASVFGKLDGYALILYGGEDLMELVPGDIVTCNVVVDQNEDAGKDDESMSFRSQGVRYVLFARSEIAVVHGKATWPEKIRMWLRERILALYEGDEAGFLLAILTGDRSKLAYSVRNDLSVAGLRHAVAVSGMHVSMLLAMLSVLCGRNPRLTAVFGVPTVIAFALMTGASASACRAAFMHILLLTAPLLGREHDTLTSLSAAALLLLLCDPWAVADVSFQLSFAAVLGLILLSGPIHKKILSLREKPGRLLRFAASGISATVSATIFTLPLNVIYFRQISLVSIPVNLLTLWAVTAIFTVGLISCFLGGLGVILAWPVSILVRFILGISHWIARFPYAAANVHNPYLMAWACIAYVLAAVLFLSKKKLPVWWCMGGLTAAFLACICLGRWNLFRGNLTFTAVDVGQGQCLILQSGDCTAVIDCGGSYPDEAGEEAVRVLHSAGITRVDALIVTHFDLDHTNGVSQLMKRVSVDRIFVPQYESEHREALETAANAYKVPVYTVGCEVLMEHDGGWVRLMAAGPGAEGNEAGLCVLAKAAEYDILITGDRSGGGELELLNRWPVPDVDLLVAGHHGAPGSTSDLLLTQTKPETVIISVAAKNDYGHPAAEVLRRIETAGAEILRTDQLGTITVTD